MDTPTKLHKSELLLPVGDMQMCQAAIHNGADAVYIGMPGFNARGRTKDHTIAELKEMVDLCHLYDVKVHLAFNILIFEDELERAVELLKQVLPLGIDAFIVQDIGLAKVIRSLAPNQVIHGSTQMTVTNELAMKTLEDLELDRFVLGREVSIEEMKKIRLQTSKELEVFVHGALCVAYSGQCFTSEAIGGRSANRGQCAQSCRLDYDLIIDGKKLTSLDRNYVVSPKDLYGLDHLDELQKIGIDSFKVEGRLKGPQYVASVGRLYKSRIEHNPDYAYGLEKKDLERTFSRGFFSGWLEGVDHQQLVDGSYSNHRGEYVGVVEAVNSKGLTIKTHLILEAGMGLLFTSSKSHSSESGGFIYDVKTGAKGNLEIGMGQNFSLAKIQVGDVIYLNKDPKLDKKLLQTFQNRELLKRVPIEIKATLRPEQKLSLEVINSQGVKIFVETDHLIEKAMNQATTAEQVEQTIGALGTSAFKCIKWNIEIIDEPFVPQKFLKDLKRKMLEALTAASVERNILVNESFQLENLKVKQVVNEAEKSQLNLLVRSQKQLVEFLDEAESRGIELREHLGQVILDYEFGKNFKESLELLRAKDLKCVIATTRILKPGEYHNLNVIKRLHPDAVLVRNLGALEFFKENAPEIECVGDFSLNVTNSLSFNYLINKGLSTLALGLDLNQWQTSELLKNVDGAKAEVFIHHHMPEFHMEHCVFAAFLSKGSSFKDCGKPCEKHQVSMKDAYGELHYLAADQECRNTMFKKTPISSLELLAKWKGRFATKFRYEALWDDGVKLLDKVLTYSAVLKHKLEVPVALEKLKALEGSALSLGQLDRRDTYSDRKQRES